MHLSPITLWLVNLTFMSFVLSKEISSDSLAIWGCDRVLRLFDLHTFTRDFPF